ncbi:DUF6412 domain-containing protein [Catelliglobosispora koreensis]|uniref:DUF6412 domain-containing protein n=1 Tax=Catelliglobosispora koreensis TaxID=129052 RepID=UPI0012FAB65F|nr:DUF6412 domain-containing protein [Catelliglobosispora koreensis]
MPFFALLFLLADQPHWTSAVVLTVAAICLAIFMRPVIAAVAAPSTGFGSSHRRPVYLRQRDPDAAGHPRPRAPGR